MKHKDDPVRAALVAAKFHLEEMGSCENTNDPDMYCDNESDCTYCEMASAFANSEVQEAIAGNGTDWREECAELAQALKMAFNLSCGRSGCRGTAQLVNLDHCPAHGRIIGALAKPSIQALLKGEGGKDE